MTLDPNDEESLTGLTESAVASSTAAITRNMVREVANSSEAAVGTVTVTASTVATVTPDNWSLAMPSATTLLHTYAPQRLRRSPPDSTSTGNRRSPTSTGGEANTNDVVTILDYDSPMDS